MSLRTLELFAGAGGMALGLHRAGWRASALVEYDKHAAATLRAVVADGRLCGEVIEADAREVDFTRWRGIDLLCGGPPCGPFSAAGKWAGEDDGKNGWPMMIRAAREARPRLILAENVRGMLWDRHLPYRRRITRELRSLGYRVRWRLFHAADYGVPQVRERVIMLAAKGDPPAWPEPTHHDPRLGRSLFGPANVWRTAGEAIGWPSLDPFTVAGRLENPAPCGLRPAWGEKHPPTTMDRPAYTVVARHAARNNNMVEVNGRTWLAPWQWRTRWQTFPDEWPWQGSRDAIDTQIGNAVPPLLAKHLGRALARAAD